MNAQQQCLQILETYGGKTADKAAMLLLEDPALKELKPILEFVSKNWRDPLRPAMIKLSCEAVGGKLSDAEEVAVAMSLMNLSFYLWDDLIDKAPARLFKPTLYGKFGEGPTLIAGGLASAKAFTILNQIKIEEPKRQAISDLFWNMWAKMAEAETINLKTRVEKYTAKDKLLKIETEAAASLATCLQLGAIMGKGSEKDNHHLAKYGHYIGIILELQHDFRVTTNQTLELAEKMKTGALPYTLLWAKENCQELQKNLDNIMNKKTYTPKQIEKIVKNILTAKAIDEINENIEMLAEKALYELETIKKNSALIALRSFIDIQPRLFRESYFCAEANIPQAISVG